MSQDFSEQKQGLELVFVGKVQGVGFRPTLFRLASDRGLCGTIVNSDRGVVARLEGAGAALERFVADLELGLPPHAQLERLDRRDVEPVGASALQILASEDSGGHGARIPADLATCDACLRELIDPDDRRFAYPFINCTHCGPRFTIVKALPYDRPATTMAPFPLCPDCLAEYRDLADRRYHAEPVACPACGPQLRLETPDGKILSKNNVLQRSVELLRRGKVLAIKGLGGFHLAVDARNAQAVSRLRQRKGRPDKPLAVMVRDLDEARLHAVIDRQQAKLLTSHRAPIVLLEHRSGMPDRAGRRDRNHWLGARRKFTDVNDRRVTTPMISRASHATGGFLIGALERISHQPSAAASENTASRLPADELADGVAPGNPRLGLMLPYTPLHHLLCAEIPALVMTSGNHSEEPIVTGNAEARRRLGQIVDALLTHDRQILCACEDSVVQAGPPATLLVRRSRGHVPDPLPLPLSAGTVLATGGQLKNTFCLTRGRDAFLGPHIGDLDSEAGHDAYLRALKHLQSVLRLSPEAVVHDAHPDYATTLLAERSRLPTSAVQHHHAHIAAVLADHGSCDPALGLALDGTGFGDDGTIWGGELLFLPDPGRHRRLGHLQPFALPGGELCIRRPARAALGLAWSLLGERGYERAAALLPLDAPEVNAVRRMLQSGVGLVPTSSCGRLFDAVAALCGLGQQPSYEGQPAVALEQLGSSHKSAPFEFKLINENQRIADPSEGLSALLDALERGHDPGPWAAGFHRGLARVLGEACEAAAELTGVRVVALGGGCFHNRLLTSTLLQELGQRGLNGLLPRRVPVNDGGLALGQAMVHAARVKAAKDNRNEGEG